MATSKRYSNNTKSRGPSRKFEAEAVYNNLTNLKSKFNGEGRWYSSAVKFVWDKNKVVTNCVYVPIKYSDDSGLHWYPFEIKFDHEMETKGETPRQEDRFRQWAQKNKDYSPESMPTMDLQYTFKKYSRNPDVALDGFTVLNNDDGSVKLPEGATMSYYVAAAELFNDIIRKEVKIAESENIFRYDDDEEDETSQLFSAKSKTMSLTGLFQNRFSSKHPKLPRKAMPNPVSRVKISFKKIGYRPPTKLIIESINDDDTTSYKMASVQLPDGRKVLPTPEVFDLDIKRGNIITGTAIWDTLNFSNFGISVKVVATVIAYIKNEGMPSEDDLSCIVGDGDFKLGKADLGENSDSSSDSDSEAKMASSELGCDDDIFANLNND